jgi:hypothetical protein
MELYEVSNHENITDIFHSRVFRLNFVSSILVSMLVARLQRSGIPLKNFIIQESLSKISLYTH